MKKQATIIAFLMLLYSTTFKAQCTSNASYASDEEIFKVTLGTLSNSSNCSTTGGTGSIQSKYSNYAFAGFAGGVPNVDLGCSTPFSVQIGTCGGSYGNCTAIYIDWNNDGDWIDAGEKVYNSAASSIGAHTESGIITVPLTATLGNCKMRVITSETSIPTSINPCGVYNWGETEDYFVNVTNNGGSAPYVSSNVGQLTTNNVSQCATFQQIICIPVVMGTGCAAGVLTQFQLDAGSSTNLPADVSKIHIFYTGTSNMYTAANEFVVGGTVPTGASNTINGSQTLVSNATNYFWVTYDMNMASTLGNLVDGACSQITVNGNTQTPTITDPAGSGTITTCGCSFTLGNDVTLCAPINYTLNGPSGYNTYTWSPGGAHTQNLAVNSVGTYTCSATMITGGLVTNGNFSSGNSGFSSNYVLGTGGTYGALSNPGTYSITTNPKLAHSNFAIFGDHTTGTGNMMVCNGSAVANDVVWTQTISITPNTNYNFSAWVASAWGPLSSANVAQLQFSINGVLIGPVFNAPLTAATWVNFFVNWNSGSATSAVITIVDQNITAVGANDFALDDITFERICTFTDIINVNSGSTSTVSVPSIITACNNGTIAASNFTSTAPGVTYSWSNTNTSIGLGATGTGNTPTFMAVNSGTTAVSSIITVTPSIGSCIGTPNSYTIIVNPTPIITVNSPTICSGTSAVLSVTGASNYSWSTGATTSSISVSPTNNTTYTVTGETSGCTETSTVIVTVNPIPTVTANATNAFICLGNSTTLSGVGASTYTWTGGVTDGIGFSPTSTASYTVTGTSAQGCTNTAVQTITVNTAPSFTVNNAITCPGIPTILSAAGASNYTWSTGATTTTISVSPTSNTVYTVTGATNGCSSIKTATVSISPSLSIGFVNSPIICAGTSTVLTATGATNYTWSTGANTQSISVSPTGNTIYTVTGETSGCTGINTVAITVNSIPTVTVNATNSVVCSGNATTLNGGGAATYTWSGGVTNGAAFSPTSTASFTVTGASAQGCTNTAVQTITVKSVPTLTVNNVTACQGASVFLTALGATNYTWSTGATTSTISPSTAATSVYTVTGESNGCAVSKTATVTVNLSPTLSVNNSSVCSGSSTTLTATPSVIGGTYTWSPGNQNSSSISLLPLTSTNYTVMYSVNGCSTSAVSNVMVTSAPQVSVASVSICDGETAILKAIPSVTGGTYLWGPLGQTNQSITVTPLVTSVYGILYSLNGCTATATGSIIVNQNPTLVLTPSSGTVAPLENVTIVGSGNGNYLWSTGETSNTVIVNPRNTTTYCATITNAAGCKTTTCLDIIVMDESTLYVPNVFTPNGDGVNDIFYTPNHNIEMYELSIFNRWGQLLFNSTDPLKGWDGQFEGQLVQDGVYAFILKARGTDNVEYNKTGQITVFK